MGKVNRITKSGITSRDMTPEEESQAQTDYQNEVDRQEVVATEEARLQSFKNDVYRQEFIDKLKSSTANEVESFVRSRIDADSVTDLATAQACMKRIETGMVRLLQLVAFVVKN